MRRLVPGLFPDSCHARLWLALGLAVLGSPSLIHAATNSSGQLFTLTSLSTNAPVLAEARVRVFAGPAHWSLEGTRSYDQLGFAVAAGRFSGGARPELALAQPGRGKSGCILSFSFHETGAPPHFLWRYTNHEPGMTFRGEFSSGDVNGDGLSDLLIGMPLAVTNSRLERQGLVFACFGSSNGLESSRWKGIWGTNLEATGRKILLADLNRDGRADLLMASANASGRTNGAGQVRLAWRADHETGFSNVWSATGGQDDQYLGSALAVADINGDGWPDIIVGN